MRALPDGREPARYHSQAGLTANLVRTLRSAFAFTEAFACGRFAVPCKLMKCGVGAGLMLTIAGGFAACSESEPVGPAPMHEQGGEPSVAGNGDSLPFPSGGVGGEMAAPAGGAGSEPGLGGFPANGGAGGESTAGAIGGAAGGDVADGGAGASYGGADGAGGEPNYVPIACDVGSPRAATGLLNGQTFSTPMQFAGSGAINSPDYHLWQVDGTLGDASFVRAWGTTTFYEASAKIPSEGRGYVRMPIGLPLAGEHLCSAKTDAMAGVYNAYNSVHFRELSTLGKCPATAGEGSLTGCFRQTPAGASVACGADEARIKGTIGTTSVDERWVINTGASQYSSTRVAMTFGRGGLLDVALGDGGAGELIFPSDGDVLPGLVVCVGVSKVTGANFGSSYVFTLDQLGSLGTCPGTPVTGLIDACY